MNLSISPAALIRLSFTVILACAVFVSGLNAAIQTGKDDQKTAPSYHRAPKYHGHIMSYFLRPYMRLAPYRASMERLRRSADQPEDFELLNNVPSRRSASHPCRWKLCGAHFGYSRRF
uniref:Secreted protein n=1 Tax=Panagrellus redivivus TaxID=6233 RepID=A0A7E4VUG6_PANRE